MNASSPGWAQESENASRWVLRVRSENAARAPVLAELRAFYAPYNAALAALLRKRGQAHTARYVESWRENASTAKLPATTAERE